MMQFEQVATSLTPASLTANYHSVGWYEDVDGTSTDHYVYMVMHIPTNAMYIGQRSKGVTDGTPVMLDEYGGSPTKGNHMHDLMRSKPAGEFVKMVIRTFEDRKASLEFEQTLIEQAYKTFGKHKDGGLVCNLRSGDNPISHNGDKARPARLLTPEQLDRMHQTDIPVTKNSSHSLLSKDQLDKHFINQKGAPRQVPLEHGEQRAFNLISADQLDRHFGVAS